MNICMLLLIATVIAAVIQSAVIRECGSTLYVGIAQGVSFSLYIGIGAKFQNMQKTAEKKAT